MPLRSTGHFSRITMTILHIISIVVVLLSFILVAALVTKGAYMCGSSTFHRLWLVILLFIFIMLYKCGWNVRASRTHYRRCLLFSIWLCRSLELRRKGARWLNGFRIPRRCYSISTSGLDWTPIKICARRLIIMYPLILSAHS